MKTTGIVRPVDRAGRLVLPMELRRQYGLLTEDASVEIFVDGDMIILRKYAPACIFCNSLDDVVEYKEHKVCRECAGKLFTECVEEVKGA